MNDESTAKRKSQPIWLGPESAIRHWETLWQLWVCLCRYPRFFSSLVIMPLLNLTFILVGQATNVRFLPIKRKSNLWLSVYKWIPFLFLSIFQSLKMISFYVLFVKCLLWFGHLVFHSVKRHIQAHKVRWATTIFTNHQLHTIIEHQQHRNNNSGINVISFWFYVRAIS